MTATRPPEQSKKLLNAIDDCVDESISGFLALNPGLCSLKGYPRVVVRADLQKYKASGRVTTLTGGGSGHEPAFFGYVGLGMMSGCVHGAVFASPGPNIILAAIRALACNHPAGLIIVFNNYTGDRLNFGIAIERARSEGLRVGVVINADDCAIDSKNRIAGRRGLNGGIALMKMVGAMAEQGRPFDEILQFADNARKDIATLGVCLTPCSLPGGGPLFELGPDDMEIGMGLHGEAGVKRSKLKTAKETVAMMLHHMTDTNENQFLDLEKGSQVAILFNNLGATSDLEMNIVANDTLDWLENKGFSVERAYSGRFIASQEMQGFSITIIKTNKERNTLLDAETLATAWVLPYYRDNQANRYRPQPLSLAGVNDRTTDVLTKCIGIQVSEGASRLMHSTLHSLCRELSDAEEELNALDRSCGDGDCGSTLKAGVHAISAKLGPFENPGLPISHPYDLLMAVAGVVESAMGGSSGALYSLFLTAAAVPLMKSANADDFLKGFRRGIEAVAEYGGAEPGDRTMLDPLHAAALVLEQSGSHFDEKLEATARAAEMKAAETAGMVARAGRASYVARERQTQPDPGAQAVALWLRSVLDTIKGHVPLP